MSRPLPLSHAIPDAVTQRAVRQLEQFVEGLSGSVTTITTTINNLPSGVTLPIAESDVTGLVADLAGKALSSRSIATTAPLTGGGDLTADRTIAISTFDATHAGVVPASGGSVASLLRGDGTWAPLVLSPAAGLFGDGSDGSATLDGTSTVLGMVPSGNVYTLTRDVFFLDLAINTGVTLKSAGYRVFISGTWSGPGVISNNGSDGTTSAAGGGGGGGGSAGVFSGGQNGGVAGNPGASTSAVNQCPRGFAAGGVAGGTAAALPSTSAGGNGGNGGSGQGGGGGGGGGNHDSTGTGPAGGSSGSINIPSPATDIRDLTYLKGGYYFAGGGGIFPWHLGTGGGGGATGLSDDVSNLTHAGGGGGSGGYTYVAAHVCSSTGSIQAKGGNGGNGANGNPAAPNAAGGAGGGGGAGGIVGFVYASGTAPSLIVTGGTGGTGGTGANLAGAGGNGGNGGNGIAITYYVGA